ncbi:sugar phosphate isomerase/epimerase family protein [Haloferula chungangensis]|uniref:Sugar phosphate isomerase/epimerase family protein n=1 Tax=Haloferula chungangensis TaxID=1048331 RepID=A0ABW2L957_9BACT
MQERRDFLKQAVAAGAFAGFARADESLPRNEWPILLFEKPVQALSYDEIGEQLASMGAQGIEATIRKGGHILPENAAKEVPGMIRSLEKSGLRSIIAASDVTKADKRTEEFLNVLKDNGITRYRLGFYRYEKGVNPFDQVQGLRDRLQALAELNEKLGMQGVYQLHSGHDGVGYVGSLVWDIAWMLKDIDPDHLGLAYDLRHTRNDTGHSWKQAADVAHRHIRAIYIKDAKWEGERSDKRVNCALDTGFVNQSIFNYVRKDLQPMPISLHMEWGRQQIYPKDTAHEAWAMIRKDMKVLIKWRNAGS